MFALIFLCLDVVMLVWLTVFPLKGSALSVLMNSNIMKSLIVLLVAFSLIDGAIYSISYLVNLIDRELAIKFEQQALKIGVIISVLVGMLTIETPDQFELMATLVSFVLIFNFFFPKEFSKTIAQIKAELIHKWSNNKNKKNNQK